MLDRVAPTKVHWVDSNVAKITRIALTSLLFAYAHMRILDCSSGGGIDQLVGGIIYGCVYEFTDLSLFGCMQLHWMYNLAKKIFFL